ncbi:MAG: hypothetical protein HY074_01045 [Deltaproteobacteria bacterium]|nr:hypothetical protein [Deltaproteobacteria bacterium]
MPFLIAMLLCTLMAATQPALLALCAAAVTGALYWLGERQRQARLKALASKEQ